MKPSFQTFRANATQTVESTAAYKIPSEMNGKVNFEYALCIFITSLGLEAADSLVGYAKICGSIVKLLLKESSQVDSLDYVI